jgi:hypothetical protein
LSIRETRRTDTEADSKKSKIISDFNGEHEEAKYQ